MVAQYLANVRFGSSISRIRSTFCEANVPVVVSLMVPLITPVNEVQMKPRLMMAAFEFFWRVKPRACRGFEKHHAHSPSRSAENRGA